MKAFYLTVTAVFLLSPSLFAQERDLFYLYSTKLFSDYSGVFSSAAPLLEKKASSSLELTLLLEKRKAGKTTLLHTKKGNPVELYFFPGTSEKNAMVIGGMHGSELSSIEVAHTLIRQLSAAEKPFYNVVVIPSLFPDNAEAAREDKGDRILNNTGRYTNETIADPNRQMPLPGKPFDPEHPFDACSREMEKENQALLALVQQFRPNRFLALHAIKDRSKAGVFADPRTDCTGNALGYETDKALALLMAQFIQESGGACPGNHLNEEPTTIYYLDPPIAKAGHKQVRNYEVSNAKGQSRGISMGTWCSTAVCGSDRERSRPAIRTFTLEFPGSFLPAEYKSAEEQQSVEKMIALYAASVQHFFLQSLFVEENEAEVGLQLASN